MFELIPRSSFGSLLRLRDEMDDLWSRFFDMPGSAARRRGRAEFAPAVDISETAEALEVSVEVPGMKPEEIEVTLTGQILTIKGEKKEEREEKKGDYRLVERSYGSFERSFRLPAEVDQAKLKATHKDGVLKLVLPKTGQAKAKKIEIKAE